jgi:hypothetical protein
VTWFLVRLLLTVPFLLWWWAWAGRDRLSAVTGALVLALVWATYGHFLGPTGLPDLSLRIVDPAPPGATVEFLDYRQLWLISFPIYLVVMAVVLLVDSVRSAPGRRGSVRPATAVVTFAAVLLLGGAAQVGLEQEGTSATVSASGPVQVLTGGTAAGSGEGEITIEAEDMGGRVTPLPPHDRLTIDASITSDQAEIEVTVRRPMVEHPLGEYTTWWGVGLDVEHHGRSGIGSGMLPAITSEVAAFGIGSVTIDGEPAVTGVPVHVMTAEGGLPGGGRLALEVGLPELWPVPGLPEGSVLVVWQDYRASVESPSTIRYAVGFLVTLAILVGAVWLARREPPVGA